MSTPCIDDNLTFDANSFIKYALNFGPKFRDYFSEPLHILENECKNRKIKFGYFESIKEQSYRNIVRAVFQLAEERGINRHYVNKKYKDQGIYHLDKIFSSLHEFEEMLSKEEFDKVLKFFKDNEKDITKYINLQHLKSNIPEDHDIELFVFSHNTPCSKMFLISDDSHFVAYEEEIEKSNYNVVIVPMKDARIRMRMWKWTS